MTNHGSDVLRLAIIGCGTIGQIKHIPNVVEIDGVELHALCDASRHRVETLSKRYGVENRFLDAQRLIEEVGTDLDGLIVSTPSFTHPEIGICALEADIPVLMEKPLSLTGEGADELVAAAEQSVAPAMVGYMKRYGEAYQRFNNEVDAMGELDFVSILDVDPAHRELNDEMYDLVEPDFSEKREQKFEATRLEKAKRAIGTDDETLANGYYFRLEHACHDLDLLRSVFGEVSTIEYVNVFNNATNLRAVLDVAGINCAITEGWSSKRQFEQWIRADSESGTARIDFTNSFLRNSFDEVTTKREGETRTYTGSSKDSFRAELEHFISVISGDAPVRTPFASARDDVQLMRDLFEQYQAQQSD